MTNVCSVIMTSDLELGNMLLSDTCHIFSLSCFLRASCKQVGIEINKNFKSQTNKLVTKYLLNCHILARALFTCAQKQNEIQRDDRRECEVIKV